MRFRQRLETLPAPGGDGAAERASWVVWWRATTGRRSRRRCRFLQNFRRRASVADVRSSISVRQPTFFLDARCTRAARIHDCSFSLRANNGLQRRLCVLRMAAGLVPWRGKLSLQLHCVFRPTNLISLAEGKGKIPGL